MPSPAAATDDGLLRSLLESAGGFVLGAAVTLATFRTRLSKIDGRLSTHDQQFIDMHNAHTVELTRLRSENTERHAENQARQDEDRRMQRFTLQLLADVARKMDVGQRVDDKVVAFFLTDKEG